MSIIGTILQIIGACMVGYALGRVTRAFVQYLRRGKP